MKKTAYMAPAITITKVELHPLMDGASITSVGGDAGITPGDSETPPPATADSRFSSIWDDEEE